MVEIYTRTDACGNLLAVDSPAFNYIICRQPADWALYCTGDYSSYSDLVDALIPQGIVDGEGLFNYVLRQGQILLNPNKELQRPKLCADTPTLEERLAQLEKIVYLYTEDKKHEQ